MALGQLMLDRKAALEKGGIPDDAGHAIVAKAKGTGDSSAAKARKTTSPLRKTPAKTGTGRTVKSVRARASR